MDDWTSADDVELKRLEAEQAAAENTKAGNQAVDQIDTSRTRVVPKEQRKFSLIRVTVGGLRDAGQGVIDFLTDGGATSLVLAPVVGFPAAADIAETATKATNRSLKATVGHDLNDIELPHMQGEEDAGVVENISRALVSFAVPFTVATKAVGAAKAANWLGRAGRVMVAGGITDFATQDPEKTNLANVLKDTFGLDNDALNALASEPDENRLEARLKAAAVNAPLSILTDAAFEAGLRGVRAYRAWRGAYEDADAAVKAARADFKVTAPQAVEETADGAIHVDTAEPKKGARAAAKAAKEAHPETIEDAFEFLKRKTAEGATEEDLRVMEEALANANPAQAFERAGLNPLKVDFSAMDDPEMLGRLQSSLQDIYEGIATRLGRTGVTVSEQATARAARVLGSTADTLKDLYGHTENLDAIMYASQTIVGAHATKLVGLAERAIAALKAGTDSGEWLAFLEAFHRHAYFLGALRGAGSEVGRALRTLQMVQKVGKGAAQRAVKGAVEDSAKKNVGANAAKAMAEKATDGVTAMTEDSEKLLFLSKLIDTGGDLGDMSRFVRSKAGSAMHRLDAAVGETRGNLFAAVTGLTNAGSAIGVMGLNGMAKAISSVVRMSMSPLGAEYSQAARIQNLQTWAYVDGILGGWRAAIKNTFALLQREGMEEVALNADAFGAKSFAAKAAGIADEGRKAVKGNFERVDVSSRARALAMNSADMRYLHETIESWNTPALMEHSMKWLLAGIRPAVSLYGSASRIGTILFVNLPDQLTGTVAARAGAQAKAMQIAAVEAGELQLEGKALKEYMKARMVQITENVDGFADDAYSAGQREAALAAGEVEAKGALFQDNLEFAPLRAIVGGLNRAPFAHLLVPFVKTPLRILERTAIDYSPLGILKDRIRADIAAGGSRRDEALARIGLGTMLVMTAFQLSDDRDIVGDDNSYTGSARLGRPSYSLRVGDDVVEFKRFDPIGTLLGFGADLRAYLRDQEDVPEENRGNTAEQIIEASIHAATHNILNKTWLTSLRDIVDLASDVHNQDAAAGWARYLQSFATRFVPASGVQRSAMLAIEGVQHDAAGFIEGLLKQSIGSPTLPVKRDPILGRPVPVTVGERLIGLKAGAGPDEHDPLVAELDRLSFDIPRPSRSLYGVKMNSVEFNRWLELKGQVVTKDSTGFTLEQALTKLIELPEYKALPRAGKVQAIRDEMDGYSQLASQALVNEDHNLALKIAHRQTFDELHPLGKSDDDIDNETEDFARQLGLLDEDQPLPDLAQ